MWQVVQSFIVAGPTHIPDGPGLECTLQMYADKHSFARTSALIFERYTDQVDVFFMRGNRKVRFMTLMAV